MLEAFVILGVTIFLILLGVIEWQNHLRNISSIPIRIHVNGTRGKSSVVRLIAAGLRQANIPTYAKTTGTIAMQILPDGNELPVTRLFLPNIIEQVRLLSVAVSYGAQAIVIECMALQPQYQSLCELKFIQSTHGVITNVGPDHLDVMGPRQKDVALSLVGTVPVKGKIFTSENEYLTDIKRAAEDRETEVVNIGNEELAKLSDDEMARFDHIEHKSNVALALKVCQDLGVDRDTALAGMWGSKYDPGAMTVHDFSIRKQQFHFVNAFGANDPRSTENAWFISFLRFRDVDTRIVLVNCRNDRPYRSIQLGSLCASWSNVDQYVVFGQGVRHFVKAMTKHDMPERRFEIIKAHRPEDVLKKVTTFGGNSTLIVGIGNTGKGGLDIVNFIKREDFGGVST